MFSLHIVLEEVVMFQEVMLTFSLSSLIDRREFDRFHPMLIVDHPLRDTTTSKEEIYHSLLTMVMKVFVRENFSSMMMMLKLLTLTDDKTNPLLVLF